jgi:hypothetical protein
MISKELYEALYSCNGCDYARYEGFLSNLPNIHELAHKCKEWAKSKNLYIVSMLGSNSESANSKINSKCECWVCDLTDTIIKEEIYADTEPEAIFKACQWILENNES